MKTFLKHWLCLKASWPLLSWNSKMIFWNYLRFSRLGAEQTIFLHCDEEWRSKSWWSSCILGCEIQGSFLQMGDPHGRTIISTAILQSHSYGRKSRQKPLFILRYVTVHWVKLCSHNKGEINYTWFYRDGACLKTWQNKDKTIDSQQFVDKIRQFATTQ